MSRPRAAPAVHPLRAAPAHAGTGAPTHHRPDGGFRNPWPVEAADGRSFAFFRWQLERLRNGTPARPARGALPLVKSDPARPRGAPGELRITWIGHATFLIQIGDVNVLTDPVWSKRASPLPWLGPARLAEPGLPFDALPPIDVVLISHDHYDHLDRPTVRRLNDRFGAALRWITPLGYAPWLGAAGVRRVIELDWWQHARLGPAATRFDVVALPAQHWTRRSIFSAQPRLWTSYCVSDAHGARVYFGGDSGYFDGYREIGRRCGPFDATLLPIGAYEPRWFMRAAHMNPEEAVQAYQDLGGTGTFTGMHWGTFQLTDEPVLEPPERVRLAWRDAGLDPAKLWVPRHGETRLLRAPHPAEAAHHTPEE